MATRDRASNVLRTLERLETLSERPRVVLVDNGSSDPTVAAVRRRHPAVEVVELGENAGAAARTVGVEHVDEPYVAFSDDDSWWAPGALSRAAEIFDSHPRLGLLAARVLVGEEEREDPVSSAMAAGRLPPEPGAPGPPVLGFVACGAVVRRSAFLEVGGFESRFGIGGEEELLALDLAAAGWQLAYVPEVVAHHHPSPARDSQARVHYQKRNELWSAWLRSPASSAMRRTARVLGDARRDEHARAAVIDAVRGLPWVLRERRPVSPELERARIALEGTLED